MNLLIATRNAHKLEEIRAIFQLKNLTLFSAFDFPDIPDVVEDGKTLEENAIKKAVEMAKAAQCWTLADDSGLEVSALDGAPGVFSARYADDTCSYEKNNEKLLAELAEKKDRTAQFRTVIALSDSTGNVQTVEGICSGKIIDQLRGENGFGYDPLFVPDGYEKTFAELSSAEKNNISHRAKALQKAVKTWRDCLEHEAESFIS